MIIRARAPCRLGLAGGGTDVSPFCDRFGGYVLNAAIAKYAYAVIEPRSDSHVAFQAVDKGVREEHVAAARIEPDGGLDLHKAAYNRVVEDFNGGRPLKLTLTTFNEAPPGSGLGSSSTLVVAMLKAFDEWLNLSLDDYALAQLAFRVERIDAALQGGRQDQYAATFGGINFMEFYGSERVIVNPLRVKSWIISELEASLVLFYTGVSRESAQIIAEQANNVGSGIDTAIEAMLQLKNDAVIMKEAILKGKLRTMAECMESTWRSKKKTAGSISNPRIEALCSGAHEAGALAAKVSGAGGGGFMMFLVDPLDRVRLLQYLGRQPGETLSCQFSKAGTQAWRIE